MSKADLLPRGHLFDPAIKLEEMQALPLDDKIWIAKKRIVEWHNHFDGKVYVSFSGGKDSTVLLHLVRSIFPETPAVFVDTGLEYPEIREFVATIPGVETVRPKMPFGEVIKKHGYPVISKEQANSIEMRKRGWKRTGDAFAVSKKWEYLIKAPFKISNSCCNVMKKRPAKAYETRTGRHPIIGTMASESNQRTQHAKQLSSCNSFDTKRTISRPLTPWSTEDVWAYIKRFDVPYCKIYDMGYTRTGCMFCGFGAHMDTAPNRFQRMAITHPKQWRYCMDKLGMRRVLAYIGVAVDPVVPVWESWQKEAER